MPLSKSSTFHYGFKKLLLALVIMGGLVVLLGIIAIASGGFQAGLMPLVIGGACIGTYFMVPGSYYVIFSSMSGLSVTIKLKTKDPQELDRMCDLAFEAVRVHEQGGVEAAYRAA